MVRRSKSIYLREEVKLHLVMKGLTERIIAQLHCADAYMAHLQSLRTTGRIFGDGGRQQDHNQGPLLEPVVPELEWGWECRNCQTYRSKAQFWMWATLLPPTPGEYEPLRTWFDTELQY